MNIRKSPRLHDLRGKVLKRALPIIKGALQVQKT